MEDSLRTKLSALEWIPNGEVDDTRFEKLMDDLVELLEDEEKRIILFNVGLIPTLSRTISHDDERISSISIKLLGRLSFLLSKPSSSSSLLIESSTELSLRLISIWKDLSPAADPIIVESLCLFLSSWIPVLIIDSLLLSSVFSIIKTGLYSTSHFVRSSAVGAFQALCNTFTPPNPTSQCSYNQTNLKASVCSLTTQIVTHPSSQTVFAIVSAVSSSPLFFILQDHPAIDFLWDAIIGDSDTILAEYARCCLRTMLENQHGNLLLPSDAQTPTSLISRLENSMMHSLRRNTRNSMINCISLLELKVAKQGALGEPFFMAFSDWAQSSILEALYQLTGYNSDSPKHSFTFPLGQLAASDANKKTLIFDILLSVLIKSSLDSQNWSQIVPILLKGISDSLQTYSNKPSGTGTPSSFWTFISKTCKLLASLPFFDPFQNSELLIGLMSQLLSYIATPVTTKVALLSLLQHINSLALCTPNQTTDWHWFDATFGLLKASRFSQAWEVRHSVIQLVGSLAIQCPDMKGILERNLFQIIVSGMVDASEHVREATHTYLTQTKMTPAIFSSILDGHPSFLWNTFCTVDAQSSSRITQAGLISALFHYDLVLEELTKVPDFHSIFHHTLHGLISDDDWDVRKSVLSILEVVISFESARGRQYWNQWKCEEALQTLLNDESRMVKLSAWTFMKDNSSDIARLRNETGSQSLNIDEISSLISDLAVEAHYNPDDEVYPLAPNVADNDLDCPF